MLEKFLNEFKDFALNSKSLDIAIGMLLGAGIKPVANSMVDDFIMPLMGFIGKNKNDLKNKYLLLKAGSSGKKKYKTIEAAQEDGAIVISYGHFVAAVLNFVILSGSAYLFVKIVNNLKTKKIELPDLPGVSDFKKAIVAQGLGGLGGFDDGTPVERKYEFGPYPYKTFPEVMNDSSQPYFKPRVFRDTAPMYDIHNQYYAHKGSTGTFASNAFPGWEDFSYDSRFWRRGQQGGIEGFTKRKPSMQVHFPLAYSIWKDPNVINQLKWTE